MYFILVFIVYPCMCMCMCMCMCSAGPVWKSPLAGDAAFLKKNKILSLFFYLYRFQSSLPAAVGSIYAQTATVVRFYILSISIYVYSHLTLSKKKRCKYYTWSSCIRKKMLFVPAYIYIYCIWSATFWKSDGIYVYLTTEFSWSLHIQSIFYHPKRGSLGGCTTYYATMETIHRALIQPFLEYANVKWNPQVTDNSGCSAKI